MGIKSNHPNLTQIQIAQKLEYSVSTIKRYRDQIKMPSPHNSKNERMNTQQQSVNKHQVKAGSARHVHFANGGKCHNDKKSFSGKELIDKAFNKTG